MKQLFQAWKDKIQNVLSNTHIEHVGGSSIPGAETKGDLDISIQTTKEAFENDCKKMEQLAAIYHPEIWTDCFAVFNTYDGEVKIDIMLVIKDSKYDTFAKIKEALIAHPHLLEEYNSVKRGLTPRTNPYYQAKKAFFNKILGDHFDIKS